MFWCCCKRVKYRATVADIKDEMDKNKANKLGIKKSRYQYLTNIGQLRQISFLGRQGHKLENGNVEIHLRETTKNEISP